MICPLLSLFAGSQEKYDSNINMLTEAAKHFDSQSTPVFQAVKERKKIEILSDADFETWMIEAWQYKVRLLKLLTRFVKEQDKEKV